MPAMKVLTTVEASNKYTLSTGYLRHLLIHKRIRGRQAPISKSTAIWLIDEPSLKKFLSKPRKPGPKPRRKKV